MLAAWKAMHPERHIPYLKWLDQYQHSGDKEYLESVARFSRSDLETLVGLSFRPLLRTFFGPSLGKARRSTRNSEQPF
jgi:hypothetical protein